MVLKRGLAGAWRPEEVAVAHDRGEEADTGDKDCNEALFLKIAVRTSAVSCVPSSLQKTKFKSYAIRQCFRN